MSRIEIDVVLKSPINLDLVSPNIRRQVAPRAIPFGQALANCRVVDKDETQDRIVQTLREIDLIYKKGGISCRDRAQILAKHEKTILEAPPAQQPSIMGFIRRQFGLDCEDI